MKVQFKDKDYEKQIRADAIDEVAEKLEKRFLGMEMSSGLPMEGVTWGNARRQLKEVVEQLKE